MRLYFSTTQQKAGVDTVGQMVRYYSCQDKSSKWSLAFFMNCLDIAAVNALVI